MHIPPMDRRWNINTIITVLGFLFTLGVIVFGGGGVVQKQNDIIADFAEFKASIDRRVTAVESDTRQIGNLAFRMTAAERDNANIAQALDELQEAVSQQSGDLRVIKEIMQRIEQGGQVAFRSP